MNETSKASCPLSSNCINCGNNFTHERSTAKFCSNKCKQAVKNNSKASKRKKKAIQLDKCAGSTQGTCPNNMTTPSKPMRVSPYRCRSCRAVDALYNHQDKFLQSTIGLNVIETVFRAGTVETFQNLQDLDNYVDMLRMRKAYDATRKKADFNICHLSPLKGKNTVGLTNAENCVIGQAEVNRKLGNKNIFTQGIEGIHYLNRDTLNPKWKVAKDEKSKIRGLLVEYFGNDLDIWAKKKRFTPRNSKTYQPPARRSEALFLIIFKQLFGAAAKVLDTEERHNIGLAWQDYQYQYLNKFDEELCDVDFAKDDVLKAAGEAIQSYLLTGNSDDSIKALELLERLIDGPISDQNSSWS